MKKPQRSERTDRPWHFDDPVMLESFPRLYEAMASPTYSDGSTKGPGLLIAMPRARVLGFSLKVIGSGLVLYLDAPSLSEGLSGLDALLGADTVPWQDDPKGSEQPASKRKRA